jgi:hypothetical protein
MIEADTTASGSLYGHNQEKQTFLLRRLLESPAFRDQFITRFADLLNSVYLPEKTNARIDQFAGKLRPEMEEHVQRWRFPGSVREWNNNVQALRVFASKRPPQVRRHIMEHFGLKGLATLTIATIGADSTPCAIRLNTINIPVRPNSDWSGIYFRDLNVTAEAIAPAGYHFVQWQGLASTAKNPIAISLLGDGKLTAIFSR